MLKNKRAAEVPTGGGAATVIGLILLLFVFYFLTIPPAEREKLLYGEENETNVTKIGIVNRTLLSVDIGSLDALKEKSIDHTIPNVNLIETRNAKVLAKPAPMTLRKGWFTKKFRSASFSIPDIENTENVFLSFQTPKHKGVLTVKLNDQVVFEGDIEVFNPAPIALGKELLQQTNVLDFEVSGVGLAFWSTNEYSINDIKVVGDILDPATSESTNVFTMTSTEYNLLERSTLSFVASCEQRNVGVLEIMVNNKKVYAAVPDCETLNRQEIFAPELAVGKNTVTFRLLKGSARLEQIKVKSELKEVKSFVQYFALTKEKYQDVLDKDKKIILEIEFVDDGKTKEADLNVNGRLTKIDQKEPTYTLDISNYVIKGNNYLALTPKTTLNIVNLEVREE